MLRYSYVILFLCIYAVVAGKHDVYKGYSVHGIKLTNATHKEFIHSLELELDLDVWQHGTPKLRDAMVMVSRENTVSLMEKLDTMGLDHYVHLRDVAQAFEEHDLEISAWKRGRSNVLPFEDYPRYAEVDAYLEKVAQEHPDIVTLVNAGPSFEGRAIKYVKISTSNFADTSKPIYFLTATVHAREWVVTPAALYMIQRLVDRRPEDQDLLDSMDWIILPMINPDGYEYSHTTMRLWRRTRSFRPEISSSCYGADGNRNYDAAFASVGVSSNPCSDIYPGPSAFSEVETSYVRDIMQANLQRIQIFMDIHSYGNYITYGFGDARLSPNVAQQHHVAAIMGAAIDPYKLPQAPYYVVGNSNLLMYETSGCAQDYAQTIGIPLSYTLELPEYGFDFRVPPSYIGQINSETWHGVAASARAAVLYYRARN
ncbi:carboxypeptidase B-like [Aricia agestis]|uniref:carboxypeptidase B-like n=1 Tax=Aricia agestis TaxID=91739 RepID=UPI001C206FD9|nr:carboxypeptidase B-like [Aricia agestis]